MHCPKCGSDNIIKGGFQYKAGKGKVQQYVCKDCGRRTTKVEVSEK